MLLNGAPLPLLAVSTTSSIVVASASLDVFRFNRTGDNERGEDVDICPFALVRSAISTLDKTFRIGGRDAGLGLAVGDSSLPNPSAKA